MITLQTRLSALSGVGPKITEKLERLGLVSVRDMLFFFPRRYEDYSKSLKIGELQPGKRATTLGIVWDVNERAIRKKLRLLTVVIRDETGQIRLSWFNKPYLRDKFQRGESIRVSGLVEAFRGSLQMNSPHFESEEENSGETGSVVPIYPETKGLNSKWFRKVQRTLLDLVGNQIVDRIPQEILLKESYPNLIESLREVHFPTDAKKLRSARMRIGFEELLELQIQFLLTREKYRIEHTVTQEIHTEKLKLFKKTLPFSLTSAQSRSVREILTDLKSKYPMMRLLEGDVGSGKTVVAAVPILNTAKSGMQTACMVPSEIVATQHFHTFVSLLSEFDLKIGLLTSSKCFVSGGIEQESFLEQGASRISRTEMNSRIQEGKLDLIVGTQALIQKDIVFSNLGFVIIDEQHRFGIRQRTELLTKGNNPDMLAMTATPIPRTLALALFGDLDISIIDEMPKGRKQVITKLVPQEKHSATYDYIKDQLDMGHQMFAVCPLIEESESLDVPSATELFELYHDGPFREYSIGLLHGKMTASEKEERMQDFIDEKTQILVSTSMVEVGVNIPNATVILIEGAERFGLSQLHQFRGRVGRGGDQAYCFLYTHTDNEEAISRLKKFEKIHDGFALSKVDLGDRGPGEIFGVRQSGVPDLKMASLLDTKLLATSRKWASQILLTPSMAPELMSDVHSKTLDTRIMN